MSDQENGESGQHGFILGILVGILIALLFTTQKGRRLLKVISSEGAKKFGSIDDMLAILMRELGEDAEMVEDPVVGEDLKEEIKEIEPPKKEKKVEEEEAKKIEEEKESEVESELEPEPEKIEKIDTEHLEKEIEELKEEIEVLRPAQDEKEKLEKIETSHIEEAPVEEPKKKSRRLFKGIRRK